MKNAQPLPFLTLPPAHSPDGPFLPLVSAHGSFFCPPFPPSPPLGPLLYLSRMTASTCFSLTSSMMRPVLMTYCSPPGPLPMYVSSSRPSCAIVWMRVGTCGRCGGYEGVLGVVGCGCKAVRH